MQPSLLKTWPKSLRENHGDSAKPLTALQGPATKITSPVPKKGNIEHGKEINWLTGSSDQNDESENLNQQEDEAELRHSDEEDELSDIDEIDYFVRQHCFWD
jgi:hypothetical protein